MYTQGDIDHVEGLHDSQLLATNMRIVLNTDGPTTSRLLSPPLLSPTSTPPFDSPNSSPTQSPLPSHSRVVSTALYIIQLHVHIATTLPDYVSIVI